jgi:hypothetical protein
MDSDRATNDGTGNAIRSEWIDEHACSDAKPVTNKMSPLFVIRTERYADAAIVKRVEQRTIASVRLRFLRSFVVNSVTFAASNTYKYKS